MELVETDMEKAMEDINSMREGIKSPKEIFRRLGEYVIGQEQAKKILSVAAYRHYNRIAYETYKIYYPDIEFPELQKSNVLMLGTTGSGKTLLARSLAKILDLPLYIADATKFTEAGYVGGNVEDCVAGLVRTAGSVDRAQFGIIMIDEADKLRKTPGMTGKDVGGESVQQQLLALMEGSTVTVEMKGHGVTAQKVQFDTSNVLFILCGAFAGIEDIVRKRTCKFEKAVGFGANIEKPDPVSASDLIMQVTPKDLTDFGMIPELIGRVPVKAKLRTLTEDELVEILTEPKDSVIKGYKAEFRMDGVSLYFEEETLKEIARISVLEGTGARGLRTIVDNLMLDIVFKLPFNGVKNLTITKKMLEKSLEKL